MRDRGFALVSVLWTMALLSLIAAAMLASSIASARMNDYAWNRARAATIADAGVEHAILSLYDPHRDPDAVLRVPFAGSVAEVRIEDERGKIDINFAGTDILSGLFKSAGVADAHADDLAKAVVAARRKAPLQSLDELLGIRGLTPTLLARLRAALTLYSHNPNVDMNTAPKEALEALPGFDAEKAEALIAARKHALLSQTDAALADTVAPAISYHGAAFSIHVAVRQGNARVERLAVVRLTDDPLKPVWFLDWQ